MMPQLTSLSSLTPYLLLSVFGLPAMSCAETEPLRIQMDFQDPIVFQHSASIDVSLHSSGDGLAADRCLALREALETSPPSFADAPLRSAEAFQPCDVFDGSAVLPDLPREDVAYLVAVRDSENRAIATGCAVSGLDEFSIDDTGLRVLTIVTLSTALFDSQLAGAAPPFALPEVRCAE